ncbi:MAG: Beta-glucosidase-related glycosidase, partial [Anaerocolumna sp.]|nr:Beta-glucosidase-related glycosidase [Anaerocolumna sp.]
MKTYESKASRLQLAKNLALEGIVLLENKNAILPLKANAPVAVFGRAQLQTQIGGSGSGATSSEEATIILEELKNAGLNSDPDIEDYYRREVAVAVATSRKDAEGMPDLEGLVNSGLIYEIFGRYSPPVPEFPIPEELVTSLSHETTALLVIGRNSGGEECDRRVEEDYYLTETEEQMIKTVTSHFTNTVLILNINGFIDLSWIERFPSIQAIVYLGTAGEQGAAALAEVLTGKVSPSGKLAATMAYSYEDYPSSKSFFSNKDKPETILTYEDYHLSAAENGSTGFTKSPVAVYEEGIYVGYRYFDTFHKPVQYPFGYGLSYADFGLRLHSSDCNSDTLSLVIEVTNTSKEYSGKEVVQLYLSAPDGILEKPYQELITYEKSKYLAPGENELLTLSFPLTELACYDESSASYLMEAGDYFIRLGNSSRNTSIIGKITVPSAIVTARYKNRLSLKETNKGKLEFLSKKNSTPYSYSGEEKEKESAPTLCMVTDTVFKVKTPLEYSSIFSDEPVLSTLLDVKNGTVSMDAFVAQFSPEELAVLVNGFGPGLPFGGMVGKYPSTISYENGEDIAVCTHPVGSAGYVSPALLKYGIPSVFYKDGPAGVQMIAWPTGMPMACTFNRELLYQFGHACGAEAELMQVDSWLAPAVNIQRSPIGGRNFEYYSEDPRHTGFCGLAITLGTQENNKVSTCPKHFAINEQETYRRGSINKQYDALDSIIEERAAREIYLKPFEMIIRTTKVSTIMSSFNKINGTFAAGNKDLCIGILREEWGYDGIVVTDWGDMDIVVDG